MDKITHERHDLAMGDVPFIFKKTQISYCDLSTVLSVNWHESIEIIYAVKGKGRASCDFTEHPVKEGDLFVVNSDVFHGFCSDSREDGFEYYYIIIGRDFCRENGLDTDRVKFRESISDPEAAKKFENIVAAYGTKGEYSGLLIRSAVLELLHHLCVHHIKKDTDEKKKKKSSNTDNIRAAIVYIRENIAHKLTTKDIARASGISEYYFIREFKRITRYTPVTYINIVRCDTAYKMLYEGDKNVSEVAALCGFENMPYFTKTFKKYTGMLPSDVKREKKKKKK